MRIHARLLNLRPQRLTVALLVAVAALAACDRKPKVEAVDTVVPATSRVEMPGIPASGADTSVPAASQALTNGPPVAGLPTADGNGPNQRADLSTTQEQQSMPLPGQANGHSNTVTEDQKPASAPAR